MRLINAEELFSKVGDIKPANSQQYHDITDFMNMITNQSTIKAIPIEVLEELKAEIREHAYPIVHSTNSHELGMTLYGIEQVIDRKISEVQK